MLTNKEKLILRLLLSCSGSDYSINQIAKECKITPNGAYKILKKFEKEGVLRINIISNIRSYKLNFDNEKTEAVLELALIDDLSGRVKYRLDDLKSLKDIASSCVLFGSYISLKREPGDLDALFLLDRANYKNYRKVLNDVRNLTPVKIHDVIQTEEDLKKNLLAKDKAVLGILRKGVVLWGQKVIVQVVKDVYPGKA